MTTITHAPRYVPEWPCWRTDRNAGRHWRSLDRLLAALRPIGVTR